ncbi:MAG TPA: FG-GAP-like repeat-containing protein, partial [Thermoanaerobaculia bacterium]|nr:FG-GAP-like repeat-containing protein [Thermoanaerobaculia bacterium]
GDLDIYATNGPGRENSLYANQLAQGNFTFVEVPAAAGAAAREQDSTGACFGDTDNDGDLDL